eukprot:TRINITY_DN5610_c0_g1_i1.p1 TRINITY_DN5610_c0_g1~~TRINITY_DN5610_c0_g1_i1.p1  ORF type:complete len:187 (+),score=35.95 TRINITY_DN5610_c0_g1_i1:249-809(+)
MVWSICQKFFIENDSSSTPQNAISFGLPVFATLHAAICLVSAVHDHKEWKKKFFRKTFSLERIRLQISSDLTLKLKGFLSDQEWIDKCNLHMDNLKELMLDLEEIRSEISKKGTYNLVVGIGLVIVGGVFFFTGALASIPAAIIAFSGVISSGVGGYQLYKEVSPFATLFEEVQLALDTIRDKNKI